MFYFAPWFGLSALELGDAFADDLRLGLREGIVGIDQALRLDEDAILLFGECDKVPFPEIEGFKHLFWDNDLASLSDALLSWGCLGSHAFRVSDRQKLSRQPNGAEGGGIPHKR